jgi:hypothetical protein
MLNLISRTAKILAPLFILGGACLLLLSNYGVAGLSMGELTIAGGSAFLVIGTFGIGLARFADYVRREEMRLAGERNELANIIIVENDQQQQQQQLEQEQEQAERERKARADGMRPELIALLAEHQKEGEPTFEERYISLLAKLSPERANVIQEQAENEYFDGVMKHFLRVPVFLNENRRQVCDIATVLAVNNTTNIDPFTRAEISRVTVDTNKKEQIEIFLANLEYEVDTENALLSIHIESEEKTPQQEQKQPETAPAKPANKKEELANLRYNLWKEKKALSRMPAEAPHARVIPVFMK